MNGTGRQRRECARQEEGFSDYRLPDTEGYETAGRRTFYLFGCIWEGNLTMGRIFCM